MNRSIITSYIILAAFMSCNSPTQDEARKTDDKKESAPDTSANTNRDINSLSSIRQEYEEVTQAIEHQQFDSTSFEFDCHGEKTGRVTFYLQDDKLRMVEKSYNELSHRDATEQYFVVNDQPFFMYFKVTDWVFDSDGSGVADATRDNIRENRYYFVNDSLVSCLEKNYIIRSASSENPKPDEVANKTIACPSEEELLTQYQKLLEYRNEEGKIGCL